VPLIRPDAYLIPALPVRNDFFWLLLVHVLAVSVCICFRVPNPGTFPLHFHRQGEVDDRRLQPHDQAKELK